MIKLLFDYEEANSVHVSGSGAGVDLPSGLKRSLLSLPNLSEVSVVRHFLALSKLNYGVDNGFYPLGSCTMKYNSKVCEDACRLHGFAGLHPLAPAGHAQGALRLMFELENDLCDVTGFDAFCLQPAAGAHGELACCMIAKKHFNGKRSVVIVPDSAHGTNPASAAMCGFEVKTVKSNSRGGVDLEELKKMLNGDVALFMLTDPNTLGLFEENMRELADAVHKVGALLYCDGANMNAMLGVVRPGDRGFDMIHLNLHKSFGTPHGGGGPGSGPIGVKKDLVKYLPVPRVVKNGEEFSLECDGFSDSIGRVRSFYGNFGVLVRAYAYIKALGPQGLKDVGETSVLSANYIRKRLQSDFALPFDRVCAHECVFSNEKQEANGVHTMDIAKRLLDYGFHAPTIYFPLIVHEAIMIEPTETESKETIDSFVETMKKIAVEARENPQLLLEAPHATPVRRLDGVKAARSPDLTWEKK